VGTRRVDRHVSSILVDTARTLPEISSNAVADSLRTPAAPAPPGDTAIALSLSNSLSIATRYNRDLQSQRESLYRQTLDLMATRRDFGWALSGTLSYILQSDTDDNRTGTGSLSLDAGHPLISGGTLTLSGAADRATTRATDNTDAQSTEANLQARLDQPLLAGAGPAASREPLRQAERDLIDALRTFALKRQDSALAIVATYYNLLTRQAVVENTRKATEQSTNLRRRTEALFRVRRAPAIDVMRAQQQELTSRNQLAQIELDYDVQFRRFLVTLGLPESTTAIVEGAIPSLTACPLTAEQCETAALECRPDILTARDRCADAERRLAVANNGLLPKLDAYAQVDLAATTTGSVSRLDSDTAYSAGLTLTLPLDQRDERDQRKRAQLDLVAARRDWDAVRDTLRLDIRERLSRLGYLQGAAAIEEKNLVIAEKRARNAQHRFRNGELENRDVVEAENELLSARNAVVRAAVDYELARLSLLRFAGLLDIDPDGQLVERRIPGGK
jgi:outer membrane protein TolC